MISGSRYLSLVSHGVMAVAVFLVPVALGRAQDDLTVHPLRMGCYVRGEIENMPQGAALQVELSPATGGRPLAQEDVESDGNFSFDAVPAGDYIVRVTNLRGDVVHKEFVSVWDNASLEIRLPEENNEQPPSGTISVQRLQRKIPRQAVKEVTKAAKASHKGDVKIAVGHLRKAIRAYPDYMEAHNNLGVCYLRLNRLEEALSEFQAAHQLDPDAALVNSNLSAVLLMDGRYAEAETAARRALKSDPTSDKARYALGLSLKAQNRAQGEALDYLRRVAPQFPNARLAAADILVQQGHRNQAIRELRQYLRAAVSAADRLAAQSWLARLQE